VTDFRRSEVRVGSAALCEIKFSAVNKNVVILMLGTAEAGCHMLSLNYVTYLTKLQSMSYGRSKNLCYRLMSKVELKWPEFVHSVSEDVKVVGGALESRSRNPSYMLLAAFSGPR
jgi:hypothetical protein